MRTPVVLVAFNRPDATRTVLGRIREARPPRLFVVADAPRDNVPGDRDACGEVRRMIDDVDWCPRIDRIFAERNMGCRSRVSSGLSEIFREVPEAIILEDDCLPDLTFFRFCDDMLERYRFDDRVMSVSGANFQYGWSCGSSYFASRFAHVWGWASWRRAWNRYDAKMEAWPSLRDREDFFDLEVPSYAQYWRQIFDRVRSGSIDSWAYPWTFSHMLHRGLAISPDVNLVENLGFAQGATHTARVPQWFRQPAQSMRFPLLHPETLAACDECDGRTFVSNYLLRPPEMPIRLPRWISSIHKRLPGWRIRHQLAMGMVRSRVTCNPPGPVWPTT